MRQAAWTLMTAGVAVFLIGMAAESPGLNYVALFLLFASSIVALTGPDEAHRDARRRNPVRQARRR